MTNYLSLIEQYYGRWVKKVLVILKGKKLEYRMHGKHMMYSKTSKHHRNCGAIKEV